MAFLIGFVLGVAITIIVAGVIYTQDKHSYYDGYIHGLDEVHYCLKNHRTHDDENKV